MSAPAKRGRKKKGTVPQQQLGMPGAGGIMNHLGMDAYSSMQGMQHGMPGMQHGIQHGMQHSMQHGMQPGMQPGMVQPGMQGMQHQGMHGMPQPSPQAPNNPMLDMVKQAITSLANRKGSSLQAIKKFLNERYQIDFTSNPAERTRVSKAVKTGVSSGVLIQEKNSYKVAPGAGMYGAQPHMGHGQHQQGGHQPGGQGQFGMQQQFAPMGQYGMHPQFMQPQNYFHQPGAMGGHPHMAESARDLPPAAVAVKDDGKKKKKRKKKKGDGTPKRRGAGGLSKPMNLSAELAEVCGGHSMGRTEVVKRLWTYIKGHSLQNPQNKREIMCDDAFRRIFGQESVDMFDMNRLVSNHLSKPPESGVQDEMQQPQQNFYSDQVYQDNDGDARDDEADKQQDWHNV